MTFPPLLQDSVKNLFIILYLLTGYVKEKASFRDDKTETKAGTAAAVLPDSPFSFLYAFLRKTIFFKNPNAKLTSVQKSAAAGFMPSPVRQSV